MSDPRPNEASRRIAAEALALRRSPLDPVRVAAAADAAGLVPSEGERVLLDDLLERLGDPALGAATLGGDTEGAARLATLVAADAVARGERRLLWIGPRPRAVDRLAERCALRLVAVRNERGAYDGEGIFAVDDLDDAPPGLGKAAPFDRVVTHEAAADPPWRGPALTLGVSEDAAFAPPVPRAAPGRSLRPPSPAARAVDEALAGPLRSLAPALGPLARAAAAGSIAARVATLARLETRLGRMVRAARAGRTDDGAETARQLASDHDGLEALLAEALAAATEGGEEDIDGLEAERAQLAELRDAVEAAPDPIVEALVARARRSLAEGRGVAIVLPARALRDALSAPLAAVRAEAQEIDARLDAAGRGPAVAILSLAEHRAHRLDPPSFGGLQVLAHRSSPIPAAHHLFGEGEATDIEAEPRAAATPTPADERWARWLAKVALEHLAAHPAAQDAIDSALRAPATPWEAARLVRDEGEALLLVGEPREHEAAFPSLAEATFHGELPLLRVARRRLERALEAARSRRRRAREALAARRQGAEQRIAEARRRQARASGAEARSEAAGALVEAEAALAPLREEERAIGAAYEAERRAALERFASQAAVAKREGHGNSSHPRERVRG